MGNKEKGAAGERELFHMFSEAGFKCVRVAGSGLMQDTACDLIVGKFNRKYAIEAKTCKTSKRYLEPKQIEEFLIFSEIFGLKPIIAVKFSRKGWFFVQHRHIERTGKNLAISLKNAEKYGKKFEEIIK